MPFRVVKSKRKPNYWDVENADTGEIKNAKPYPVESKAQDYAGALNANSEVSKADLSGALTTFAQLAKIDLAKHQVWGVATAEKPDAVWLSTGLLVGVARRIKKELGIPVLCSLQGEDSFLDGLPEPWRTRCWAQNASTPCARWLL